MHSSSSCLPYLYLSLSTEQREVRAQPSALLSPGSVYAAVRRPPDGPELAHSSMLAIPTSGDDLEADVGKDRSHQALHVTYFLFSKRAG